MFCHMIVVQHVTWKRSDWHARMTESAKPKKVLDSYTQDPLPYQRVGSGNRTTLSMHAWCSTSPYD